MLRFIDGFDFYATADLPQRWNANASATISSGAGRFSSGALVLAANTNSCVIKILDNQATWAVGAAYSFGSGSQTIASGNPTILMRLRDGATCQVDLRMNNAGVLYVTRNGTTIGTGTRTLVAGVFYYIEMMATIGSSAGLTVQVSGVPEITLTGANTKSTANSFASIIEIGTSANANFAPSMTIDDCYICDGQGGANNTFLGDVRVETLFATSDGSKTDFAANTGTRHGAVSQAAQDGDTTYVSSHTINDECTFNFGSLSSNPTNIPGVQTTMVARKDDAGSRAVASIMRIAGTDYPGATVGLPDSYAYFSEIRETNPATSAAWTGTEVNALDAGIKLIG